jgi:hypothetical protein
VGISIYFLIHVSFCKIFKEYVEKPDPVVLRPDLYDAAKNNDTAAVTAFLEDGVPPDFKDESSGWTVSFVIDNVLWMLVLLLLAWVYPS